MLLAGDIGGTKTDLAIFSPEEGPRKPLASAEFHSADYPSLEAIVSEFLAGVTLRVDRACFDVAGPVVEGHAKITNLPWVVDAQTLKRELHLRSIRLMNDLEAIAQAVPSLGPDDVHTINKGEKVPGGAIAVIAPGTGMGEAYLTWDGARYLPHPSEGGHSDFAPTDDLQIGLLKYVLQRREGHVSIERVCSGSAIPGIYEYLCDIGYAPETPEIAARLAEAPDHAPVIVEAALHPSPTAPCALCKAALDIFVAILGAEAGNIALKVLATGGVYLGGGIPPRIIPALEEGRFLEEFRRKGRMRPLLELVPIHVITVHQVALIGAAICGLGQPRGK